jgi:hypothetical protein
MLYSVQDILVISRVESAVEFGVEDRCNRIWPVDNMWSMEERLESPPADQTRISHPNPVPRIWM